MVGVVVAVVGVVVVVVGEDVMGVIHCRLGPDGHPHGSLAIGNDRFVGGITDNNADRIGDSISDIINIADISSAKAGLQEKAEERLAGSDHGMI